jgi:hypothetical protein
MQIDERPPAATAKVLDFVPTGMNPLTGED